LLDVAEPPLLSEIDSANLAEGADRDITVGGDRPNIAATGKRFKAWFMTPGVINYEDCKNGGQELLRKETIDEYLHSLVGTPLTIGHIPTNKTDFEDVSNGTIDKVGFDADKGWHYCEGDLATDQARNCINDGWGISVGMRVSGFGPSGMWLNNPYDREIKKIKFHHLALVEPGQKPRIDQSEIRLNSTAKKPMNIVKLIRKAIGKDGVAGAETTSDLAIGTKIDLGGGKSATIAEMIESERMNHTHSVMADDYVEHEGVRYHCGSMISAFKERQNSGLKGASHVNDSSAEGRLNATEKAAKDVKDAADAVTKANEAVAAAERLNVADAEKAKAIETAKSAHADALRIAGEATERFNSLAKANKDAADAETKRLADEKAAADKKLEEERNNALAKEKKAKEEAEAVERENARRRSGAESFAILAGAQERGANVTVFRSPSGSAAAKLARGRALFGSGKSVSKTITPT
jgi:hypothetical protein